MSAKSRNTLDVFKWIFDMIDSCKDSNQLISTSNLTHLYFNKYQELRLFDILIKKIDSKLKQFKQ